MLIPRVMLGRISGYTVPDADPKSYVGQNIRISVDPVDCLQGHLCSLNPVLFSTTEYASQFHLQNCTLSQNLLYMNLRTKTDPVLAGTGGTVKVYCMSGFCLHTLGTVYPAFVYIL